MFIDALEPAEWSFQHMLTRKQQDQMTYIELRQPETLLLQIIFKQLLKKHSGLSFSELQHIHVLQQVQQQVNSSYRTAANMLVSSGDSNLAELGTLIFILFLEVAILGNEAAAASASGQTIYKLSNCVVNTAELILILMALLQLIGWFWNKN